MEFCGNGTYYSVRPYWLDAMNDRLPENFFAVTYIEMNRLERCSKV
jgi:hypothetical protein